jgi:hypothetical protein
MKKPVHTENSIENSPAATTDKERASRKPRQHLPLTEYESTDYIFIDEIGLPHRVYKARSREMLLEATDYSTPPGDQE